MNELFFNKDASQIDVLFGLYDRDGNGTISVTELKATLSSINPGNVTEEEVNAYLE
jgi:Ca2+-binding EF-hand superfamily protein